MTTLLSEEDIRSKVVLEWLKGHGFGLNDFSVEFGFDIQIGHKIHHPRSDIVVRSMDGRNLFVIEVKDIDQPIDEKAKRQAISYARLLSKGGIAPFTIVTNTITTHIYDSISEELLNGSTIPLSHPYVHSGYTVNCDDISLISEAIESFISLSSDNLLEFCRSQVAYRMRTLKSNDINSDKKYIPQLYINRDKVYDDFIRKLDRKNNRVLIVEGLPQVGKTNFICNTVEKLLLLNKPCLFYPAISMQNGLLEEICTDFRWLFGENSNGYQLVHNKLDRILKKTDTNLVIFIDGWNEVDVKVARLIDRESERLSQYNIKIVISMTNSAATRLLLDDAGNPSFLAEAAFITSGAAQKMSTQAENVDNACSIIAIPRYEEKEITEAYKKYSRCYNVTIPEDHVRTNDPFLLRVAMEQFSQGELPISLDEAEIIEEGIQRKIQRTLGMPKDSIRRVLKAIAYSIYIKDSPVFEDDIIEKLNISVLTGIPVGLFESALLVKMYKNHVPLIDFYYSREKDFILCEWLREWSSKLHSLDFKEICYEIDEMTKTESGINAVRWFFFQESKTDLLKNILMNDNIVNYYDIHCRLLSILAYHVINESYDDRNWIEMVAERGVNDINSRVKIEAVKIIIIQRNYTDRLRNILFDGGSMEKDLVINLLKIEEDYPIAKGSVSDIVLEILNELHFDLGGDMESHTELTYFMEEIINSNSSSILKNSAAKVYGHIGSKLYLGLICKNIIEDKLYRFDSLKIEYIDGIYAAIDQLREMYYGSLCPGYLDSLLDNPEELIYEYESMYAIVKPIIIAFSDSNYAKELFLILESLRPENVDGQELLNVINDGIALRYQLKLPLSEADISYNKILIGGSSINSEKRD